MKIEDAVWLAGLLEGEGSFDMHKGRYPRVRLAMADRDVVQRAADLMRCNTRVTMRAAPFKALWHAETSGPAAVRVMELVLPHMGARRSAMIASTLGHYRHRVGSPTPVGA